MSDNLRHTKLFGRQLRVAQAIVELLDFMPACVYFFCKGLSKGAYCLYEKVSNYYHDGASNCSTSPKGRYD